MRGFILFVGFSVLTGLPIDRANGFSASLSSCCVNCVHGGHVAVGDVVVFPRGQAVLCAGVLVVLLDGEPDDEEEGKDQGDDDASNHCDSSFCPRPY